MLHRIAGRAVKPDPAAIFASAGVLTLPFRP